MFDRSIEINGSELSWDTERGTMSFYGIACAAFWLRPSLVRMLAPLRAELGTDLFGLLVAHSSSLGTEEDYQSMVTVLGHDFPSGFLAWGRAVAAGGWGRFELPEFEPERGHAVVVARSPWELVMQEEQEEPWGCPFLRGKLIGLFTKAFGRTVWAVEECAHEAGEPLVRFRIHPSEKTIDGELARLRRSQARRRELDLQAEVDRLAAQLQQAQKMEAIGQLTGGIAHDFNNLLTVIQGNLEFAAQSVDEARGSDRVGAAQRADAVREAVSEATHAVQRASALTQRLLAFSRKQTLQPRVISVGELLSGMEQLLRRTIGEAVEVEFEHHAGLWACRVDPVQLESAVLNLALNARDAMPEGGTLRVRTSNISEGDRECVCVTVTDTGEGMPPEVIERVFEPFFTTKEVGRGSGLGLSMVYGFVRQSGGSVRIDSEPGRGTSVALTLPRASSLEGVGRQPGRKGDESADSAGELILVVEDDAAVRQVCVLLLERLGYRTLTASNGIEGMALLAQNEDVRLLVTDVVLPGGVSGPQLASQALRERSELRLLFVSGYTGDQLELGQFEGEVQLLRKPFSPTELAEAVQSALESGLRS